LIIILGSCPIKNNGKMLSGQRMDERQGDFPRVKTTLRQGCDGHLGDGHEMAKSVASNCHWEPANERWEFKKGTQRWHRIPIWA
jgi:hypothetical protein